LDRTTTKFSDKRSLPGELNPKAKLTREHVLRIRELRGKLPNLEIARMFGICSSHVSAIQNFERWAHVGKDKTEKVFVAKLTAEDVRAIRASDMKQRDIAKAYGVSECTISHIVNRKTWRNVQ
jgi:DNA invertase Pin-like site-specific DNA recombinase